MNLCKSDNSAMPLCSMLLLELVLDLPLNLFMC